MSDRMSSKMRSDSSMGRSRQGECVRASNPLSCHRSASQTVRPTKGRDGSTKQTQQVNHVTESATTHLLNGLVADVGLSVLDQLDGKVIQLLEVVCHNISDVQYAQKGQANPRRT